MPILLTFCLEAVRIFFSLSLKFTFTTQSWLLWVILLWYPVDPFSVYMLVFFYFCKVFLWIVVLNITVLDSLPPAVLIFLLQGHQLYICLTFFAYFPFQPWFLFFSQLLSLFYFSQWTDFIILSSAEKFYLLLCQHGWQKQPDQSYQVLLWYGDWLTGAVIG